MGTRLDMVFPGMDGQECDALEKELKQELMRLEGRLSIYSDGSDLSLINRVAHAGPVGLDDELSAIFREIESYHAETMGFFDVALKPLQDFQKDPENEGIPIPEALRELAGMQHVRMTPQGISFSRKGVQLDLGGYGKGYAIRRILSILDARGTGSALISFGESLVCGRGTHPYGEGWKVTVRGEGGGKPVHYLLGDETLSTSGNSLNNQKKFGNSGHIVNPVTSLTQRSVGLVSVKSSDPVRAEIYSTALFSAGREWSDRLCGRATDLEVKWIIPDNEQLQ